MNRRSFIRAVGFGLAGLMTHGVQGGQGYYAQGIGKIFHNWRQDDFKGDAAIVRKVSWQLSAQVE